MIVVDQLQLLVLQHLAVLVAQDRQQHLLLELLLGRVPVDIEELSVRRSQAVLQHVLPPQVVRVVDAHVIGHDVQQQSHLVLAELLGEGLEILLRAEGRMNRVMIDHVVAVRACLPRAEQRRGIGIADAQPRQVVDQSAGVVERQMRAELQPIGRQRHSGWLQGHRPPPQRERKEPRGRGSHSRQR